MIGTRWFPIILRFCFLAGLMAPLLGCNPITVQSDYDHSVDFSKYKTFAWAPHTENKTRDKHKKGEVDPGYKELMDKRLRTDVEEILVGRGYTKTSPENADLLLEYHFGLKQKMDRIGFRSGGRGGGISRSMRIPVTEDNIVLEMIDRETNQLVWRGWAEGELEDIAKEPRVIKKSIQEFLGDFPPSGGSI